MFEDEKAPEVAFTSVSRFQHYQIVLREIVNSIQSFRNTKELVQVFRDALEGKGLLFSFRL